MSLKLGMPLDCPCPTFGELRQPPEAHPKRARHVEIGSTRAEKPRKREKFKRKSREINKKPEQEKTQASKEKEEKKPTTSEKKDKDTSCYLQLFPGTEKTGKDNDSTSYPILETACEEHAFITELVNKPPPKIDNFFELANPFENECDMLDVSDTIFDIANEFPNICLPSKELTPDIEAFNLEKPGKTQRRRARRSRQSPVVERRSWGSAALQRSASATGNPRVFFFYRSSLSNELNTNEFGCSLAISSSKMLSNRRSLSTHRQPNGKKRVDIVYRSKWITNNFVVGDPLGAGSFGKVWTVECRKKPAQLYALKVPAPGFNPKHIAMELKVMRAISGGPNVVEFIAAYRELDRVFVVMNLFPHDDIFSLINKMSLEETLQYMRNLFIALHHIHRYRVIHRDVKPANFLYNRAERRYLLVDFGLSHFVSPNQKRKSSIETSPSLKENVVNTTPIGPPPPKRSKRLSDDILTPNRPTLIRHPKCGCTTFASVCDTCRELPIRHMNKAGTPGYRAPEVLLRFEEQTTAIDVFAAGVTMLSFLLKKHPVFRPSNDVEALTQMATFLGSSSLVQAAAEGGVTFLCEPPLPGMDMVKLVNNFPKDIKETVGCKPGCRSCMALIYQNNSGFCFCKHTESESIRKLSGDERTAFEVLTHCLDPSPSRRYTARMLAELIGSPSKKSGS
ncbi:hypothetical protein Y032_0101g3373 [Ancylostoma ceylanicum]|uniref:non-specific serine/threonine protein kinase n=2 Tax=Ancylostoma ceylanicum TaxID=53326 RepID=A0A016THZ0_9BILA|nr:hypothetical protein Y032_0101g3373 [Ancylostoma ceylanicum]